MEWVLVIVGGVALVGGLQGLFNAEVKQKMPRAVAVGLLCVGGLTGGMGLLVLPGDEIESQEELVAIDSQAVALVRSTQTKPTSQAPGTIGFNGGVAVNYDDLAVYWVNQGKVFAVNGIAKNWSPSVTYAPASINWQSIQSAFKQ